MYIKLENNIPNSRFVDIDYKEFISNNERFAIKNNQIIDLSQTTEYQNKKRIKEIEEELTQLDELYYLASQSPVDFEGHKYKFEWTNLYQGILQSGILPAKIWDLTELEENAVIMNEEKLQQLQNLLLEFQENAFQTRKEARSILLFEKNNLENSYED